MADRRERELMLGIFLMEAWDTAGALEEGLSHLAREDAPSAEALAPLVVLAHRLKGSAALYGFPGVSELAGAAERLLQRASIASAEERARGAGFLDGLVGLLKEVFDGISAVGVEDAARVGEFKARYPAFLAAVPSEARPTPVIPSVPAAVLDPVRSPISTALVRFFTDDGEVLEYFLPEAAEHLEAMTTALLAVEGGARDEETLATVFRSVHTLKGAAYTVGCAPIGDAAHQIEDLLGAVREGRLDLTPAVTEALFVGAAAIKQVLQSGAAVSEDAALGLEGATQDLRAMMASALADSPPPPRLRRTWSARRIGSRRSRPSSLTCRWPRRLRRSRRSCPDSCDRSSSPGWRRCPGPRCARPRRRPGPAFAWPSSGSTR